MDDGSHTTFFLFILALDAEMGDDGSMKRKEVLLSELQVGDEFFMSDEKLLLEYVSSHCGELCVAEKFVGDALSGVTYQLSRYSVVEVEE